MFNHMSNVLETVPMHNYFKSTCQVFIKQVQMQSTQSDDSWFSMLTVVDTEVAIGERNINKIVEILPMWGGQCKRQWPYHFPLTRWHQTEMTFLLAFQCCAHVGSHHLALYLLNDLIRLSEFHDLPGWFHLSELPALLVLLKAQPEPELLPQSALSPIKQWRCLF